MSVYQAPQPRPLAVLLFHEHTITPTYKREGDILYSIFNQTREKSIRDFIFHHPSPQPFHRLSPFYIICEILWLKYTLRINGRGASTGFDNRRGFRTWIPSLNCLRRTPHISGPMGDPCRGVWWKGRLAVKMSQFKSSLFWFSDSVKVITN